MGRRKWWLALLALAVVIVIAVVAVGARALIVNLSRTPLDEAMELVPESSLRVSFTDWSEVRDRLGATGLPDHPTGDRIESFLGKAYDADLSGASSIDETGPALQKHYGFSPANADWEAYAQSKQGAVMVLQLPDSTDMGTIEDNLRDLGYKSPKDDTGVWLGGVDLVAQLDGSISPELQYVVVLADQHVVLSSDEKSYAATAAATATGDADSLADLDSAADLTGKVGEPASAFVWTRDFACQDLSMDSADDDDQSQADQLIAKAGKVSALSGLVMAMEPDRRIHVGMQFENGDQAEENLKARARLAVGEAVGRGGSFSDDFTLTRSRTDGSTVLLDLRPKEKNGFALSLISQGPVLFATC